MGGLVAIDDFVFADYGIAPAPVTNDSTYLTFSADRRAGVYSSVFFSAAADASQWNTLITCPTTDARYALMAVLAAPARDELRLLLQREPPYDDFLTIDASVASVRPRGSSDTLEVAFESNDSVWHAESRESASKTFASRLDQCLHLPSPGNVPTNPIIRIVPTVQRSLTTAYVGWSKRQRWTITNNVDEPLFRYAVRISLDNTAALVTAGKALASGADLRVWLDGIEQPRALIGWNTSTTYLWLIIPALPAGESITYDVVYGNPLASAAHGCDLDYPDLPAFHLASSSNTLLHYHTETDVAFAGQGLWPLTSDAASGAPDYTVPGAWRPALTFENPTNTDEYFQGPARRLATAQQQRISASGTVSGGTYTISIPFLGTATAAIAYSADAATVSAALIAAGVINTDSINVSGGPLPGAPLVLRYDGPIFDGRTTAIATVNSSGLTGGGSYAIAMTVTPALWYQSTFTGSRWRGTPFYTTAFGTPGEFAGSYPFDGVVYFNPFGITSVFTNGFFWRNYATIKTVVTTTVGATTQSDEVMAPTDPFTRLVILGRDSGGDDWHIIEERSKAESSGQQFAATWTPPGTHGLKHFGIAVWPMGRPSIPDDAEGGGIGLMYGGTEVTVDTGSGRLDIQQTQAETSIYELATELRLGGGSNAIGPYHTLLVGNARSLIGPGTPHVAVALGTQGVQIDAGRHTHDIWDTTFVVKEENLSAHSVRALDGYLNDGETGEARASRWLPIAAPRRTVANNAFDAGISSWELYDGGTGVTHAATYDAAIGGEQAGSLKIAVTVNAGVSQVVYLNTHIFAVNGQESVQLSGWTRASHVNMRPMLAVYWFNDDSDVAVSSTKGPLWSSAPVVNTGYTRAMAVAVPEGATRFRVGVVSDLSVSAATGSVWFDDININDNDLFVADVAMGTLALTALVPANWVP
jgi:hypothetical protein